LADDIVSYDNIVLCGPIWMGCLIAPLRSFLLMYRNEIHKLYFATCCGSDEDNKDGKFGYNSVFAKVKEMIGNKCVRCDAFSIYLTIPAEVKNKDEAVMKAQLSTETYQGEIKKRLENFVRTIK
jgi:multimeric flavodoxin WrbA